MKTKAIIGMAVTVEAGPTKATVERQRTLVVERPLQVCSHDEEAGEPD